MRGTGFFTCGRFCRDKLQTPNTKLWNQLGREQREAWKTSGLNSDYISEISKLENTLNEIEEEFDNPIVMICGDANASIPVRTGNTRDTLFQYFCERMFLDPVLTNHKTYPHFVGHGASDSSIDVILHKVPSLKISEKIKTIICSKTDPRVDSKHDIIVSQFSLPFTNKHMINVKI